MRRALIACAQLLLASECLAGSIGVYADPAGTECALELPMGESATLYVVTRTSTAAPDGGTVARGEFRIVGMPDEWVATASAVAPVHLAVGNPLVDGVTFVFAELQSGVIPLFTVSCHATTQQNNVRLDVVRHVNPQPPWGGPTDCPWLQYCQPPCDSSPICVDGASLSINSGGCLVSVQERGWSELRSLYR